MSTQSAFSDLSTEPFLRQSQYATTRKSKLMIYFIMFLMVFFVAVMAYLVNTTPHSSRVRPIALGIPWISSQIVLEINESRVFQLKYYSGQDNRTEDDYKSVTEREVAWRVEGLTKLQMKKNQMDDRCESGEILEYDQYGRIFAKGVGRCALIVQSLSNPSVQSRINVTITEKKSEKDQVRKRIVNYTGTPFPQTRNLQKIVQRYQQSEIIDNSTVPISVRQASRNPANSSSYQKVVQDGAIIWKIEGFANDSSSFFYILRQNTTQDSQDTQDTRDRLQYFMGDRYLPGNGVSPIMIEKNQENGIWVVGGNGDVTYIKMVDMSYTEKAIKMSEESEKCIMRHGLMANAHWGDGGQKCVPAVTDNDGLWTSLYAAGELMKYSLFKQHKQSPEMIQNTRKIALKSLRAVLLIANVPGRSGTVEAKIRHLNNTRVGEGAFYSDKFLKKGKQLLLDRYQGRAADGVGFWGEDAGKKIDGFLYSGKFKYSFLPLKQEDWTNDTSESAAVSKRILDGFFSRTFVVTGAGEKINGGLWFQRNHNDTQTVLSGAQTLYQYGKDDHPVLDLGDLQLPDPLRSLLDINGTQYSQYDLAYKGDTSTDSIIAHLFLYKIAYDILDPTDPEQNQLITLIQSTMNSFCQHLLNNGYTMVDATGQATKWIKLTHQLFTSDYTIEDSSLKAIELVLSFKVAHYVTGDRKWKEQYDYLTESDGWDYLTLIGSLWERWEWALSKSGNPPFNGLPYEQKPSQQEIERHILYQTHFSDEEEAFLAIYLAFQLEDDERKLKFYRKNLEGYWKSASHSENALWYYIYQLAYPSKTTVKDSYNRSVLQTASWALSRHPIDTRQFQAYIKGSRPDIIFQDNLSADPSQIIGERISTSDISYLKQKNQEENKSVFSAYNPQKIYQMKVLPADERSIHKFNGATFDKIDLNHDPFNMQAATLYTLPYWLAVYHSMLQY